ncbi:2Fe-2S iron-sulfur cluster-binding protein [Flavobacterium luminosum]|uniref:2Fe-2S iron-sulfur cluster-binding protein n=1 Tax=Flavobacterium luminosum TaxID=2949086 RepID=A0ABT0TP34_9FLAO|nr:2Fe-2S iron-sulfur cluster-binding protein [Flavobacterium sp. HXWNR70]MCL9809247.1 2Fe-2S iron-sulfur cluster-binding protein [Flavobacterium sp. HXWNR70]
MKVTIDGQSIEVEPGTTILQAARMIGGESVPPAMCYYSKLEKTGGKCRCCLVEVTKGSDANPTPMPKLVASCVTGVMDGMEVNSKNSTRVEEARKSVTEFLLINHPLDCPVCDQAGECDLQNLSFEHGKSETRYIEEKRTFEPENIGPYIQLHMNRCILCQRCVAVADQLTDKRVHGVMDRGDHANISTCISKAIDNEMSGNMIDVCPVGALTDKTFRFKSRVWFSKPYNAHRDCDKCCGKTTVWMFGNEIQRVTGRKDEFHEVEEFICNTCRFEKKEVNDWTIEGPRKFEKYSVINRNKYAVHPPKVEINTEAQILLGREQDRKKISMTNVPLENTENSKQ